jgi:hypothetical protein
MSEPKIARNDYPARIQEIAKRGGLPPMSRKEASAVVKEIEQAVDQVVARRAAKVPRSVKGIRANRTQHSLKR